MRANPHLEAVMTRPGARSLCLAASMGLFAPMITCAAMEPSKPNIVYLLIDDLGWADVGFNGGNAPTPNIDRLAGEGIQLTQHYVAPVCTPTRTGLLTGRYPSRFGIFGNAGNGRVLPWETVTLPRALKTRGYDTAIIGKWHLGSKPEWGPNHFGFDYSYGSLGGGIGPFDHSYKTGPYAWTWHRNGQLITEKGHATDLIVNEAVEWIKARDEAPLFLYVPFTAVHLPVKEPQDWLDRVPASIKGDLARHYAACIMHMDDAVGRIVAAIDKSGRRRDTLIVFSSDNGGTNSENNDPQYPSDDYPPGPIPASNAPLRGQKATLYEGGIRVPAIANWPGQLAPGRFTRPMHVVDWMPTFCALAGYSPAENLKWDGMNVWQAILGARAPAGDRVLYFAYGQGAVLREGDWKLIVPTRSDESLAGAELFRISDDPFETTNLIAGFPEKARPLIRRMKEVAAADGDASVQERQAARPRKRF